MNRRTNARADDDDDDARPMVDVQSSSVFGRYLFIYFFQYSPSFPQSRDCRKAKTSREIITETRGGRGHNNNRKSYFFFSYSVVFLRRISFFSSIITDNNLFLIIIDGINTIIIIVDALVRISYSIRPTDVQNVFLFHFFFLLTRANEYIFLSSVPVNDASFLSRTFYPSTNNVEDVN